MKRKEKKIILAMSAKHGWVEDPHRKGRGGHWFLINPKTGKTVSVSDTPNNFKSCMRAVEKDIKLKDAGIYN